MLKSLVWHEVWNENELALAVQVPKGSFYSYFDSKEAFAAEAITHYIEHHAMA